MAGSEPLRRTVHGFRVEEHDEVTSTQDLLRRRLADGKDVHELAVRAARQLAGRGRRSTPWSSRSGGSYQSVALSASALASPRPPPTEGRTRSGGRLTLAFGLGIAEALRESGARVSVKWPNDLMFLDRKLGGIIAEQTGSTLILGVGVNVENEVPDGASALRGWDPRFVGDEVLRGVRSGLALLLEPAQDFVDRFARLDWLRGAEITLRGAVEARHSGGGRDGVERGPLRGTADGIEPDGSLRLLTPSGGCAFIVAGHVESLVR